MLKVVGAMDKFMFHWLGVLTSLFLCAFTFLLLLDVRSAFHKRASWIPGKALVLGALTIQLLAFIAGTNINLLEDSMQAVPKEDLWDSIQAAEKYFEEYYANQFVILACQLNICVFLGYFITGMVSSRSPDHLAAIAVLVIGLYFPIKNYISRSDNHDHQGNSGSLLTGNFYLNSFMFICITFLIVLLGCTVIAGITVRRILKQRISSILSTDKDEEVQLSTEADERISRSWNDFEDELFKSWIVARVSQPDYVIARSVLTSAVGVVVTFCVFPYMLPLVMSWNILEKSVWPLLFSLSVYVVEEWLVICCRCCSSLLIRKRCFCFEDFWTRALREKIDMYNLNNWRSTSDYSLEISFERIAALLRLHKLLYLLWVLQILVVLVSKFFWILSEILLGKILRQCQKHAWSLQQRIKPTSTRYHYKFYAAVLERICMPGEDPSDLWKANKRAINRITLLLNEGRGNGSITSSLFTPFSMEWVDQGFQLADKLQNAALPQVIQYFPNSKNLCWKMTVVSLTLFIIKLHKPVKSDRLTSSFKACNQVWDLLSFLDESDSPLEDDGFESGAADKEFSRLRQLYESLPICLDESAQKITIEKAKDLCRCPVEMMEMDKVVGEIQGRAKHDTHSKDWMRIAPSYYLYKLYKVMEAELEIEKMEDLEAESEVDVAEDLIDWTESSLRNVIAACVCMIPDMLAKHCRKCAQGFNEDKIWEAIYLAGKARGMMESWGLELKWSSNQWTFHLKGLTQA